MKKRLKAVRLKYICICCVQQANRRKGDEANSRELLADKLASIIAMGNLRALREEVIQHMATINR
jgi:hypothetical protein